MTFQYVYCHILEVFSSNKIDLFDCIYVFSRSDSSWRKIKPPCESWWILNSFNALTFSSLQTPYILTKVKGCLHQDLFQLFKLCYKDFSPKLRHWFKLKMVESWRFRTLCYSTQTFNRWTRLWQIILERTELSSVSSRTAAQPVHTHIQTEIMHFHLFLHILEHRWGKNMTNFANNS